MGTPATSPTMPYRADSSDPTDRHIWTEGFRAGYAGFVIRQGAGDPAYTAGYVAGQDLRQTHRREYEHALFERRRVRAVSASS